MTIHPSSTEFTAKNATVTCHHEPSIKKVPLLEYHDNVGHFNHRRFLATLLKRYWWDKMAFDCKTYCQIVLYVIGLNPIEGGFLDCTL